MKGSEIITVFLIDGSPTGLVQCTIAIGQVLLIESLEQTWTNVKTEII
jgi:hypothetical protein